MDRAKRDGFFAACFFGIIIAIVLFVIFKYALGIFLPFIVGCALGGAVRKPAAAMGRITGISHRIWGAVLLFLLIAALILLLGFAAQRLVGELGRLVSALGNEGGGLSEAVYNIGDYLENITSRLPIIRDVRSGMGNEEFWERVDAAVSDSVSKMIEELGASIPRIAGNIAAALPDIFVFLAVALIVGFFFASDSMGLSPLFGMIPKDVSARLVHFKARASAALSAWLRAYLLILGLTFIELFVGFTLLGVGYSFLAALGVALVDILPIFGAGAVLVPWAIISLLSGNQVLGVGLLVLWAVISVVRQFAEPRIVGRSLGVPPVLTLFTMYAGLRLFGVGGMIASPAIIILARSFAAEWSSSREGELSTGEK